MENKKNAEIKALIKQGTVKIKYWFSDGSTKTWKIEKGEVVATWNTYKGEKK